MRLVLALGGCDQKVPLRWTEGRPVGHCGDSGGPAGGDNVAINRLEPSEQEALMKASQDQSLVLTVRFSFAVNSIVHFGSKDNCVLATCKTFEEKSTTPPSAPPSMLTALAGGHVALDGIPFSFTLMKQ